MLTCTRSLAASYHRSWCRQQLVWVVSAAQRSAGAASTSKQPREVSNPKIYTRRQRLDDHVLQQYPQYSKNIIQSWIAQGKVLINDQVRRP